MILRESKKKLKKIWGRPSDIKSRFTGNIGNSAGIEPLVAPHNRPSLKRQRWLRRTYRVVHQWGCFLTTILHWGLRNWFFFTLHLLFPISDFYFLFLFWLLFPFFIWNFLFSIWVSIWVSIRLFWVSIQLFWVSIQLSWVSIWSWSHFGFLPKLKSSYLVKVS